MIATQVEKGMTIIIPSMGRTRNGFTITNIKPGRYKSYIRLVGKTGNNSIVSCNVPREEKVELVNDPSH